MMKRILISGFACAMLLIGIVDAQSQVARIYFKDSNHDYGVIKEDDGVAYYEFQFSNTGSTPLIIQRVETSCGCTTPDWPKEPIAPGKNGRIKVGYNPSGRPGAFSKTITVYSNAETPTVILQIKGEVIPHVKTPDEIFNISIGGKLYFEKTHIPFSRLFPGKIYTDTLKFMNKSSEVVKVAANAGGLNFLTVRVEPQSIKPKQVGNIIVTYDPQKRNDWGFVMDRFMLSINDSLITNTPISVTGSIEEDYSALSASELEKAPRVEFNTTSYDFGEKAEGEPVEYNFTIKNTGKSDLLIRKVKASCGCTTVQPSKNILKPGESTEIKALFRTNGYSGRQSKSITVITNDPKSSTTVLRLSGNVVKK